MRGRAVISVGVHGNDEASELRDVIIAQEEKQC